MCLKIYVNNIHVRTCASLLSVLWNTYIVLWSLHLVFLMCCVAVFAACVLSFCMCFLKLQCCELSWPPQQQIRTWHIFLFLLEDQCLGLPGMYRLVHKGPVWLQVFVPTSQEHTVWPINFLKTEISWLNESGLVCCCLVEKKTCSHTGPLWNSLDMPGVYTQKK